MSNRYLQTVAEVLAHDLDPTCAVTVEQGIRRIEAHIYLFSVGEDERPRFASST